VIEIAIEDTDSAIIVTISNPIARNGHSSNRKGNQMAVDNIKERLALAFGGAASMELSESESRYTIKLTIPTAEAA
jgi:two-component system sensor histidine kinase AlgZ